MAKTTTLTGLVLLFFLLSGCGAVLSGAAVSSTPTLISLPTVAGGRETPAPTPTPSPLPPPSPTPLPPAPSPTPSPSPPPATPAVLPTVRPEQPAGSSVLPTAAPSVSLAGEWDFTFGRMALTQQNMSVAGTYQWYGGADAGQIRGTVLPDLRQFQGLWLSDHNPNSQGFLHWRLAADGASFSGSSERGSTTGQWCGVRSGQPLPAGCGFSGVWRLRFGSPPDLTGQATLVQTGQTVRGTYVDSEGHTGEIVEAIITVHSITAARLTGLWRNDRGEQDSFEWRLDLTTGRTFQGRRNPGNSEWCGWREGTSEPERCGWED